MCRLLDLPRLPNDEAVALADEATAFVTRRVRSALPGVVTAIQTLRRDGYTLHTASSESSIALDGYLTGMGVRGCFHRLYGPDLVERLKDGPEYYRRILADCGVEPSTAVFVDDQPVVVEWIQAAGARAVLVRPPFQANGSVGTPTVIDGLADLPTALRSM